MKLLMYIGNDLIDSIAVDQEKIVNPGYVSSIIRTLKERHDIILKQTLTEPEFLFHTILPSADGRNL